MYKVMIVEDEMLVRLGIRMSTNWEKFGMDVVAEAINGQVAWETYQNERPDVILTDIRMPVMDGLELISRIREKDHQTQIIILSCLEEFGLVQKAMKLGVAYYLLKLTMTKQEMEEILEKVKCRLDEDRESAKLQTGRTAFEPVSTTQSLMYDFVIRQAFQEDTFAEAVIRNRMRMFPENMVLCTMEIDHYKDVRKKFHDESGELLRINTMNILNEILERNNAGVCFYGDLYHFFIIFSSSVVNENYMKPEECRQSYLNLIEQMRRAIDTYMGFSVSIITSPMKNGYRYLPMMYSSCMRLLEYGHLLGARRMIQLDDLLEEPLRRETIHTMQFINQNYNKKITVQQLADAVKYSPNYLCTIFRKETGMHITEYIQNIRIEKSRELLQYTNKKNYEIAENVGFIDESYFSRTFKKVTGLRPNDYRIMYGCAASENEEDTG